MNVFVRITRNPGPYWYGGQGFPSYKGEVFETQLSTSFAGDVLYRLLDTPKNRLLLSKTVDSLEDIIGYLSNHWWISEQDCEIVTLSNKEAVRLLKSR
jgi:hypothetical protein